MQVKRCGSQPSGTGPADYFTGTVRIDPLFDTRDPQRVSGASVTFEPGARTAWHIHPLGQTLNRDGWLRLGAVVGWAGRGNPAWATPTTAMTHVAIQEKLEGKAVEWMEKLTDEQYQTGSLSKEETP